MITVTNTSVTDIHMTDIPILDVRIVGSKDIENFKQLIQRGANLWPNASPEIKRLADNVTNGYVLQDYDSQNTDLRKNTNPPTRG